MKTARFIGFIAMFACAHAAHAMIVYESGPATDNTYNTTAPGNGAPWQYVGEVQNSDVSTDASAVYLGNDFMITANHVTLTGSIAMDSGTYALDSSYTPMQIGVSDMKLFKILGGPALATLPLTTLSTGAADLNMNSTMVGWGVGKGSVISGEGWNWGDDSTRTQRWGTNVTLSTYATDSNSVLYLQTAFNIGLGVNTASATEGDSGSALFQKFGSTWTLAGLYDAVDTFGASYYAGSPNNSSGMDYSYATKIEPYSAQITADIPEPGSIALLGLGAAAFASGARRRR